MGIAYNSEARLAHSRPAKSVLLYPQHETSNSQRSE
jgi:hypothetical protein